MKKPPFYMRLLMPLIRRSLYDLYPELLDRQPLLRLNSEEESMAQGQTAFQSAGAQYNSHMWVRKAVDTLANNIGPLPLRVVTGTGSDTNYLDAHPLYELLENPNPDMGAADLWRQWVIDMMLGGEEGFEAVRGKSGAKILELWPRHPNKFLIKPESWRYRKVAYYKIEDGYGEPYQLTPEQFTHFKFYNPLQPFRGIAPLDAVRLSVVIDQLAQVWTRLFFKNQARPDFAVIAPEGITPTERRELEHSLMERFNSDGVGKPIILEQGVTDIKNFSFAPKDLEWANQRQMSRDEIGAVFGVPDEIMGYGRDTYENFATAETVLWTLTIMPLCGLRDGALTRFFRRVNAIRPGERIETDFREISQLQEDQTGKIDNQVKLFSMGYPVNVANQFLGLGLPDIEGGDVGYLPFGLREIGYEPPTPPAAPPSMPAPAEEEPPAEPAKIFKDIRDYGSEEHAATWKLHQDRIESPTREMQRIAKREFQRQQNEINRKLRDGKSFGRGLYKADITPPVEELFDLEEEIRLFLKAFRPSVTGAVELVGASELAQLVPGLLFEIDRPLVVLSIEEILRTVARKTNESTWMALVDLFQAAEREGEGLSAIMERLSEYFGDRKSDYQTERIARTTMTGASNAGTQAAGEQAADSGIALTKTWLSALVPNRTRDAHAAAHGQTVPLKEPFVVDGEYLQYPGDPAGSAGNIINCLCTQVMNVEE